MRAEHTESNFRLGWWPEFLGLLGSIALGCLGLLHILLSPRADFLFNFADSLIMPILEKALAKPETFLWVSSPGLFIPETAQYLSISAITQNTNWALALSGALNVVLLYAALRITIQSLCQSWSQRTRILLTLAGVALFIFFGFFENSSGEFVNLGQGFELFTVSFTMTYYSATLISSLTTLGLVAHLLKTPRPLSRRVLIIVINVLVAFSTFNSPLFVIWTVIPAIICISFFGLKDWKMSRIFNKVDLLIVASLATSAAIGYAARTPLSKYVIADTGSYFQFTKIKSTLFSYASQFINLLADPSGWLVLLVISGSLITGIYLGRHSISDTNKPRRFIAFYLAVIVPLTVLGTLIVGQPSARYWLPAVAFPVLLFPALMYSFFPNARIIAQRFRLWRWLCIGLAIMLPITLISLPFAMSRDFSPRVTCLQTWLEEQENKNLVGAGSFWTTRAFSAHLPEQTIIQMFGNIQFLWLNNPNDYNQSKIDYLLVSSSDDFKAGDFDHETMYLDSFGSPNSRNSCGDFEIWDYQGTEGQDILRKLVLEGGRKERDARFNK